MRFLKRNDDGNFAITNDVISEDTIPPYAILSHTWGADTEEVTFADLISGAGKAKPGYEKIRFCGKQARQDGLQHFWIDTCCINKADKAELSRAIQSMFRWYRNAARCYVYLPDVSCPLLKSDEDVNPPLWELDLRESRWFTRGWTLQELLAPSSVEFFSREQRRLGDKISLKQQIYEITNIPHAALEGTPLSQFSVNERLRWKEYRETKREEDGAYSLLGIFDVYLAPVYGEGASGAFRRLMDEIQKLERCVQDLHSTDPRDDKKRIEDTKGGLLEDSYRWVLNNANFQQWHNNPQSRLLWIKGDPGKGKTMLLCGIINELQKSVAKTSLLSYFFCQATDLRINSAVAVLRGLLYLLVSQQPSLVSHFRKRYDHAGKSMFEDANAWVVLTEVFADVLRDPSLNTTYLIVDALDECVTDLLKLLDFVAKQSSASCRIKWIVSSRNWPDIEERLERADNNVRLSLELNAESVSAAVSVFIKEKVFYLAQRKKYDKKMQDAVLEHLALNANDTFLWVALVCQNLEKISRWNVIKKLDAFPPGLDALYKRMMEHISTSDDAELCKQVLASTTIMHRPVTVHELAVLIEQLEDLADDLESVREIISLCGSFLTVRENTVYFVHQSAKDFLFAEAYDEVFPCGSKEAHEVISSRSLEILSKTLRRDMYGLGALGYPAEGVKPPDPDPLAALRYSCTYWVNHLAQSQQRIADGDSAHVFLQKHFLHWLEAMSLMRKFSSCVHLLEKLQALTTLSTSIVSNFLRDARRFVWRFQSILAGAPLQVYCSALVFSPEASIIRQTFADQVLEWVEMLSKREADWDACRSTLVGHSDIIRAVVFSPDGQLVASSGDNTVRLWDVATGMWRSTLEGHSSDVNAVAFSPDGQLVASASADKTARLWDVATGAHHITLEGHSSNVTAIAFSPNGQLVASSGDNTVRLWDVATGICRSTLEGHSSDVEAVAFSPLGGQLVASASGDYTIRLWDVSTGTWRSTLEGHSNWLKAIAFSPDGQLVVSASYGKIARLWDVATGMCCGTLEGHSDYINAVAFSPDGQLVASASADKTVRLWEAATGIWRRTLDGHSDWVTAVAFSPDGQLIASASDDKTVQLREVATGAWHSTLEGHSNSVRIVVFSPDGQLVASASKDKTVRLWETTTRTRRSTQVGHSSRVMAIVFSPDGQLVASASADKTVRLWDVATGTCCSTLEGHSDFVRAVAFSPDGQLVASASLDRTVRLWETSTGKLRNTLEGHSSDVTKLAFSLDGIVASASDDWTVRLWDVATGTCCSTLEGHSDLVRAVAFSPDGQLVASASMDWTVRLWDATGTWLSTLKGHSDWITAVTFSLDGQRVASASQDKTVRLWDATGTCLSTLEGHSDTVRAVAFSPNGRLVASASDDKTVRLWEVATGTWYTLEGHSNPTTAVSFSPDGQVLHTNNGDFSLSLPLTRTSSSQDKQSSYILVQDQWILRNQQPFLWLPFEYRPDFTAVHKDMVCLGYSSGRVVLLRIK